MTSRKTFLKACGGGCLALMGFSLLNESIAAHTHIVSDDKQGELLPIPKERFINVKKDKVTYRLYVIVKDTPYDFPIILYRFNDEEYAALLMRCTHQGNELDANGDLLSCAAHGSEFDNHGAVITGPAEAALQIFQTTTDETTIYIHLL